MSGLRSVMGFPGVLESCCRMFLPRSMVSFSMELGSGPVRLCCVLVMFCGLVMSVFRHNYSPFKGKMRFLSLWMSGEKHHRAIVQSPFYHPDGWSVQTYLTEFRPAFSCNAHHESS